MITVIFDNAGFTTLIENETWAHTYREPQDAAADIQGFFSGEGWSEDDDHDSHLTKKELSHPEVKWFSVSSLDDICPENWGSEVPQSYNIRDFLQALGKIKTVIEAGYVTPFTEWVR